MNESNKISMPSPWVISFYFYYSYFTLIINWFIAPILLHVILTQSKTLTSFKWFILNHSFWCHAFINLFCLFKPLILAPALGGMPLAMIRKDGSFFLTCVFSLLLLGCGVTFSIGLFSTLLIRYSMIFPLKMLLPFNIPNSIQKLLTIKTWTILSTGYTIAVNVGLFIFAYLSIPSNSSEFLQEANEFNNQFFEDFAEPSLIIFSISKYKTLLTCLGIYAFIFTTLLFGAFFIFIKLIKKTLNTKKTTNLQASLILSCGIHLASFLLIILLPICLIFGCIIFQFPNSAEFGVFCMCIVCSYGIIDFSTTLYFVSPYRKYLQSKLGKLKQQKPSMIMLNSISNKITCY